MSGEDPDLRPCRVTPRVGGMAGAQVRRSRSDRSGARAAALLGDQSGAAVAYERLRPWARYFVIGGTGMVAMHGSGEFTLGCLAACLGKPGAAVRHLRSAVTANQRAGLPPFEHEARYELAKVLARQGRPADRAEALLQPPTLPAPLPIWAWVRCAPTRRDSSAGFAAPCRIGARTDASSTAVSECRSCRAATASAGLELGALVLL